VHAGIIVYFNKHTNSTALYQTTSFRIFAARNGAVSDEGLPVYAFKSGLAHLAGGEIGIANMGRNVAVKMIVPFP
jgi:hypothetical protein